MKLPLPLPLPLPGKPITNTASEVVITKLAYNQLQITLRKPSVLLTRTEAFRLIGELERIASTL